MAIGTVTTYTGDAVKAVVLLSGATATNSPPSGASAGLAISDISNLFNFMPNEIGLLVYSTAGSGTMTATIRLWSYHDVASDWFPLGTGADGTKGTINAGTATGETGTDEIRHQEILSLGGLVGSRLYAEVTAIGGTSTAVSVALVVRQGYNG